jgi:hypothetical protein
MVLRAQWLAMRGARRQKDHFAMEEETASAVVCPTGYVGW